jgi:hypothetical protein
LQQEHAGLITNTTRTHYQNSGVIQSGLSFLNNSLADALGSSALVQGGVSFLEKEVGNGLTTSDVVQQMTSFLQQAGATDSGFLTTDSNALGSFLQNAGQEGLNFVRSNLGIDTGDFLQQAATDGNAFLNSTLVTGTVDFLQQATEDGFGFLNSTVADNIGTFMDEVANAAQGGPSFATSPLGVDAGAFLEQAAQDGASFLDSNFVQGVSSYLDQAFSAGTNFANSTFATEAGSLLQQAAADGANATFTNSLFAQDVAGFLNTTLDTGLTGNTLAQDALSYLDQAISNPGLNQVISTGGAGWTFGQYAIPFVDQTAVDGFSGAHFANDVQSFLGSLEPLVSAGLDDAADQLPGVNVANGTFLTELGDVCIAQANASQGSLASQLAREGELALSMAAQLEHYELIVPSVALVNENSSLPFYGGTSNEIVLADANPVAEQLTLNVAHGTLALGPISDPNGFSIVSGANESASMTVSGSLSQLNQALNGLVYTPTLDYSASDALSIAAVQDVSGGLTATAFVPITVNEVPVPPTVVAPSGVSVSQNGTLKFSDEAISVVDANGTDEQLSLSVGDGSLDLGTTTGLTSVMGAGTGSLTIDGSVSALNADLSSFIYLPASGYNGADALEITDEDTGDMLTGTDTVPITVSPLPPIVVAPSAAETIQNGTVVFTGADLVAATDPSGIAEQLTLSVLHGTLSLSTVAGLTTATGGGTSSVFLSGPLSSLNADLSTLVYTPASNYSGADTLNLADKDTIDSLTGTTSVAITIDSLAPAITAPPTADDNQIGMVAFSAGNTITVADVGGTTEQMTLSVSDGTLALATTVGLTAVTDNGTASVALSGPLASLDADLSSLVYTAASGYSGSDSLRLTDTDTTDDLSAAATVAITVNPLAPGIVSPFAVNVNENGTLAFAAGDLVSIADKATGSDVAQLTLTASYGTLTCASTNGLTFVSGANGSSSLTVTGTLTDFDDALNGLTFTPTPGFSGPASVSVQYERVGAGSANATIYISVNAPPTITVPSGASAGVTNENGALVFSSADGDAIVLGDPGSDGSNEQLTLTVSHGSLTLASLQGLTVTGGANGSSSLTVTGSLSSQEAALNGLIYTPTAGYSGSDSLAISLTDLEDAGVGTLPSSSATLPIKVNPLPVLHAPSAVSVNENSSLTFSGSEAISVTDTARGGNDNEQLTLSVSHGALNLGTQTGLTISGAGTVASPLMLSGDLSDLKADLPTLVYTPNSGYSGADTLSLSILDTSDEAQGTPETVPITVIAIPIITAPTTASVNENTSLVFSSANGNTIDVSDSQAGTSSEQLTLSVTHGKLTLATTKGLTFSSGSNGSASMTLKGTLTNLNAALNGLEFTPTTGYSGSASLAISYKDLSNSQTASAAVTIAVNPFVTAPSTASVAENGTLTFSSANSNAISLTDGAASGTSDSLALNVTNGALTLGSTTGLTFVTGSNKSAAMTLHGTLANLNAALKGLVFSPTTGFTGSAPLSVTLTDSGDNLKGSAAVAITVSAPPSVNAPATATLTENTSLVFSSANSNLISITDAGASGTSDSLTLTVSHGKLTLASTTGLTFSAGANGSASMTVKGTLANLNAALNGLRYVPTSAYSGSDSLKISVTDAGDKATESASVGLTVTAPPPPAITAPSKATVGEDSSMTFSTAEGDAISVADPGASATSTDSLTLKVSHGTLKLASTKGLTFTAGSNNSASMTVSGTLANLDAALNGLVYTPKSGYTGTDSLVISLSDSADKLSGSASVALTVGDASAASPSVSPDDESASDDEATQWAGVTAALEVLNA